MLKLLSAVADIACMHQRFALPRVLIMVALVVVLAGSVTGVLTARSWQTEYGTWNPVVVHDIKQYKAMITPLMSHSNQPKTGTPPAGLTRYEQIAWRRRQSRLSYFRNEVAASKDALARWDSQQPPDRFRQHYAEAKRDMELKVAWLRINAGVIERHDTYMPIAGTSDSNDLTMECASDAENTQILQAYSAWISKSRQNSLMYDQIIGREPTMTAFYIAAQAAGRPLSPCQG